MVPTPARDHRSQVLGQHILALASIASDEITGVFQMAFLGCSAGFDQRLEAEPSAEPILAASMGAVLLTAGTKGKRTCLFHSRVMIHQPLGGMQGQVSDMEISYRLIKEMQKDLYEILSYHTGQDYDTIEKDCDRDNWMTAPDAKAYGLIDEVLDRNNPKKENS